MGELLPTRKAKLGEMFFGGKGVLIPFNPTQTPSSPAKSEVSSALRGEFPNTTPRPPTSPEVNVMAGLTGERPNESLSELALPTETIFSKNAKALLEAGRSQEQAAEAGVQGPLPVEPSKQGELKVSPEAGRSQESAAEAGAQGPLPVKPSKQDLGGISPTSKSDNTNPEIAQENIMANGDPIATAVARSRSPLAGQAGLAP